MNRLKPKFDILIPSYKGDKYLPLCLTSLAMSNFSKYEAYISIEGEFQNIKYIKTLINTFELPVKIAHTNQRVGLAGNRKRLLTMGKSDLILWLDDDVLISNDTLEMIVLLIKQLGREFSILTGVGSNFYGFPKVVCGLGFTLFDRRYLIDDEVLSHNFGLNTGEDWLWTARIAFKTGLPIKFIPLNIYHLGENRCRKRYSRQWDSKLFIKYTSPQFYNKNRFEIEFSYPVYNYIDF